MHGPLIRSQGDTNIDLFFVCFIGSMASDRSEHGSPKPVEEEVESHAPAPAPSRERSSRAESSRGAVDRAQQAFSE